MIQLRSYQKRIIKDVYKALESNTRCCVSLATGGGKTVIFSELVKRLKGRVLICVHREELVKQTSNTLSIDHDLIISTNKAKPTKEIAVAMVQTLWSRIKKSEIKVNSYDYIVIDECHRGEFMKVLELFKGNVIGFTATPNYEKTIYFHKCLSCGDEFDKHQKCCGKKTKKYKSNIPLSHYYDYLVDGIQIDELIEQGYLVKDDNYVLDVDSSRLVYDPSKNDYTEESISLVFGSQEAIQNTVNTYNELAKGKKTILFNPNTLVNKRLYQAMIEQGINCKIYDSNNSDENRFELVEWFKNTPDAVLLNVQIFTTGFDCTDVEVVFLNKKTKSINLYLQMVGRGGRITDKIFKPSFRVIDMGNNNDDFGAWSDPRDWSKLFYKREVKQVGKGQPANIVECGHCGAVIAANALICPECGGEKIYRGGVSGLPKINGKPTIPRPEKIIQYCERNNLDTLKARKIVYNLAAEMFKDVKVSTFRKYYDTGDLYNRAKERFRPYYFEIQKSNLQGNRNRTLMSFTNKIVEEIAKRYANE